MRASLPTLAAVIALALPAPAYAYCRTTEPLTAPGYCERGTPVAWGISCLGMHLNTRGLAAPTADEQDLDGPLRTHLGDALRRWSEADCAPGAPGLRVRVAGDLDAPLDVATDGRSVVSVNRVWRPDVFHLPGTIAFTVITTDAPTGTILEADIELNARSPQNVLGHRFSEGSPMWGVPDLSSVILHETGHAVGLWHSLTPGAVMEAATEVERQRRALTADDRRGMCDQYPLAHGQIAPSMVCTPQRPALRPRPAPASCDIKPISGRATPLQSVLCFALAWLGAAGRRRACGRDARGKGSNC